MAKKEEIIVEANETKEKVEDTTLSEKKGLSIASMVLGIVSIVLLKAFPISLACGILAIIFGNIGKKRAGKNMAKAGFIMGIISVSILSVICVFCIIGGLFTAMVFTSFF